MKKEQIGLDTVLTFGRHRGKTPRDMFGPHSDAGWLFWYRQEEGDPAVFTNELNAMLDMKLSTMSVRSRTRSGYQSTADLLAKKANRKFRGVEVTGIVVDELEDFPQPKAPPAPKPSPAEVYGSAWGRF